MSLSTEQVEALAKSVSWWRMEDYVGMSFFTAYLYYVLTTMDEEISIIRPQRWNRGKMLYMVIRYGMLVYIALKFSRDFKNYSHLTLATCKGLVIVYKVAYGIVYLACNFLLGLCLSALLQAKAPLFIAILVLCLALPFISTVLEVAGTIQYPAGPTSPTQSELGYSCYPLSYAQLSRHTVAYAGESIRVHMSLAATTLLTIVGVVTLVVRYRAQAGRLLRVVRRDGGIHYLSVLAVRLAFAIIHTYASLPTSKLEASPPILGLYVAADVIIPILAQRLLINMRKVDYVDEEPIASKLLFAPPAPRLARRYDGDVRDSLDVTLVPLDTRHRG